MQVCVSRDKDLKRLLSTMQAVSAEFSSCSGRFRCFFGEFQTNFFGSFILKLALNLTHSV